MSKRLKAAPVWRPDESVEANARSVLTRMAREYFAAGRAIARREPDPADLHPFRLLTKRFRYTLEIFQDVYGPSLRKKLDQLKPVQDALGEVNDCAATQHAVRAGKGFRQFLERRAARNAGAFYRAWRKTFDAPGQEQLWIRYLSRVPGRPVVPLSEAETAVNSQNLTGNELGSAQQ